MISFSQWNIFHLFTVRWFAALGKVWELFSFTVPMLYFALFIVFHSTHSLLGIQQRFRRTFIQILNLFPVSWELCLATSIYYRVSDWFPNLTRSSCSACDHAPWSAARNIPLVKKPAFHKFLLFVDHLLGI